VLALVFALVITQPDPRVCISTCGMTVYTGNCARFKAFEARAVSVIGRNVDTWTPEMVCHALGGWTVLSVKPDRRCLPEIGFVVPLGDKPTCVGGFTFDDIYVIQVIGDRWGTNSLAHEFIHAIDWFYYGRVGHCGWTRRGVNRAINLLNGAPPYEEPANEHCDDSL